MITLSNKEYRKMIAKADREVTWNSRRITDHHSMWFFDHGNIYISHNYVSVEVDKKEYQHGLCDNFKDFKTAIAIAKFASLLD